MNKILKDNGFSELGERINLKHLSEIILDIIAEINVLRQAVKTENNELGSFKGRDSKKTFVNEDENIEYYKNYVKTLENEISFIKSQVSEFHEVSLQQFQNQYNLVKAIKEELETDEDSEIISKISSFKRIMKIIPSLEIFVEEVCKEFVPEKIQENNYQSYSIALKQVFPRIKNFKSYLEKLKNFKERVYDSLRVVYDTPECEVIEKIDAVYYFQKLFDVEQSQDLLGVIEKLFLYYCESKNLIEFIKIRLKIENSVTGPALYNEIRKKL